jgi:hypothetical protein
MYPLHEALIPAGSGQSNASLPAAPGSRRQQPFVLDLQFGQLRQPGERGRDRAGQVVKEVEVGQLLQIRQRRGGAG